MEIMIGKLNTAIKILLLLAFEDIPESKEREAENPMAPITSNNKKSPKSTTGFFKSVINNINPNNVSTNASRKL